MESSINSKLSINDFIPNKWVMEIGEETFAEKGYRGLNWKGRLGFWFKLKNHKYQLSSFLKTAFKKGVCAVGPFYGEFGNFLLHYLPFISYLHREGIEIVICCDSKFEPFLIDTEGEKLFKKLFALPKANFQKAPSGNYLSIIPQEYEKPIADFRLFANQSKMPLLDLSDADLYWYSYRNWQLNGRQHFYNLASNVKKKNKVVLFPRKKGPAFTNNNGERLNYNEICSILAEYFDEVVIIGQPDMSDNSIVETSKIKFKLGNNETVIKEASEAQLIVSQHSGAVHVGLYTNTPSLMIFQGVLPIKGLDDTVRFRSNADGISLFLSTSYNKLSKFNQVFKEFK